MLWRRRLYQISIFVNCLNNQSSNIISSIKTSIFQITAYTSLVTTFKPIGTPVVTIPLITTTSFSLAVPNLFTPPSTIHCYKVSATDICGNIINNLLFPINDIYTLSTTSQSPILKGRRYTINGITAYCSTGYSLLYNPNITLQTGPTVTISDVSYNIGFTNYITYKFITTGIYKMVLDISMNFFWCVVGGGGAGGGKNSANMPGGGGGGAAISSTSGTTTATPGYTVFGPGTYTITVGAGGKGSTSAGKNGGISSITGPNNFLISANGGGGGSVTLNNGNGMGGTGSGTSSSTVGYTNTGTGGNGRGGAGASYDLASTANVVTMVGRCAGSGWNGTFSVPGWGNSQQGYGAAGYPNNASAAWINAVNRVACYGGLQSASPDLLPLTNNSYTSPNGTNVGGDGAYYGAGGGAAGGSDPNITGAGTGGNGGNGLVLLWYYTNY